MPAVLLVVSLLAGALAVWAGVQAIRDRPVLGIQIPAMVAVEVALVVQIVVAAATMSSTSTDPLLIWGYLLTEAILLPLAFAWAFVERTRWSSVVLAVASIVIVVLQVRIWQLWQG